MTAAECFGANLKRARRRAALSQQELARRAGLDRTAIGLLEHGKRTARIDTMAKLMSAAEVSANELMEGIAWVGPEERDGTFVISDSHRNFAKVALRRGDQASA